MPMRFTALVGFSLVAAAVLAANIKANAQDASPKVVALKNSESIDLTSVYYVSNCKSILVGLPEVEVLEGPPGAVLSLREEPVLPRRQGCAQKVAGGTLVLTAKDVTERKDGKLTYRLKYQTKDGPRQVSNSYIVSLFP